MFVSTILFLVTVIGAMGTASRDAVLTGKVVDNQGKPVANAFVLVSGCQPKSGTGSTEPTNYPNCGRLARTDIDGRFEFDSLSPELNYQLAISASGFQGLYSNYLDLEDEQTPLKLTPTAIGENGGNTVKGQIVDRAGLPIKSGAILLANFLQMGNLGKGSDPSVPSFVITNSEGKFDFQVGKHITHISFRAHATGLAPTSQSWRKEDNSPLMIRLDRGGAIVGQLVYQGQPVKARLGLVQKKRTLSNIVTPREVDTDEEGKFRFDQLPPSQDYALYTTIDRAHDVALPVSVVQVPIDGKLADLGQIELQKASAFTVSIVSSDGSPLPEGGTVIIGRDLAWHSLILRLPGGTPSTSVSASALADEEVTVTLRIPNAKVVEVRPNKPQGLNSEYTFSSDQIRLVTFVVTSQ
jgi:Carboxypeptidase regulatory-like domain